MDKLTVMSCVLFFIADAFAIVAISMPDWIVTNVGGKPGNGPIRLSLSSKQERIRPSGKRILQIRVYTYGIQRIL